MQLWMLLGDEEKMSQRILILWLGVELSTYETKSRAHKKWRDQQEQGAYCSRLPLNENPYIELGRYGEGTVSGNKVKFICRVLDTTLNSSIDVQAVTVKLRPSFRCALLFVLSVSGCVIEVVSTLTHPK